MKLKIIIFSIFLSQLSFAQITLTPNFNLELSEDSLKAIVIEKSLKAFLLEAENNAYSETYVDTSHLKEYEYFFRKLSGIGRNNQSIFHHPIILKSFTPDEEHYEITVAFTGIRDSIPFIYQITELKAIPYKDHYRFNCLFKERTANFNTLKVGNVQYYYNGTINEEKAIEFAQFKDLLSEWTNTPKTTLKYYCFNSLDELSKSYGFLYNARQCNFLCYDLGFTDNKGNTYVTGTNNENYSFGYIGKYLYYNLPNEENLYWPFVQGISTYYGGYGLTYDSMEELKQQFRAELQKNPSINFLDEFKKARKSSVNRHFSYYVMSAFICEAVLKRKEFDAVLKLAYSGKDGVEFFKNLKDIISVDESNFHQAILKWIKS